MNEFINLKKSYYAAIQFGLLTNAGYQNCKSANEFFHKFSETCIDNSNYSDVNKTQMKLELAALKEALSKEIENCYQYK